VWADRVERAGDGLTSDEPVPTKERAREALLMGLRLAEGIDLARFAARTGRAVADSVDSGVLSQCIAAGYLIETPERLSATREGRIRLDSLLAALVL
jgi:oxygen-independent coproporphyrinogen-3 oxidase